MYNLLMPNHELRERSQLLLDPVSPQYKGLVQDLFTAGDAVIDMQEGIEFETKGNPYDYLSEGDKQADALMRESIGLHFAGEQIQDEEALKDITDEVFWTLDPIDGTKGFVDNLPLWCITFTRIQNGLPVVAAAYAPGFGKNGSFFYAEENGMFWNGKQVNNQRLNLAEPPTFYAATNYSDKLKLPKNRDLRKPVKNIQDSVIHNLSFQSTTLAGAVMAASPVSQGVFVAVDQAIWDITTGIHFAYQAGAQCYVRGGLDFSGKPSNTVIAARGPTGKAQLERFKGKGFVNPYTGAIL